ncbi:glucocorticoid modulatory element-binding protein 2 isoform X1 [Acinonyx jubatus]|uniref:Glucocorticoid modulatory element-binding protein 2 isoform X1 n=1 Tax=Acinonyx jubatus TaxID=32536 RepID=A0ABM3N8C7_ACIJB|nr:glucocorticoid modulatory element-binding protein 2 isoform X1 [Acinonyx jubatus]
MGMQISLGGPDFISFGSVPRRGLSGQVVVFRNPCTVFLSSCTDLHSHQQCLTSYYSVCWSCSRAWDPGEGPCRSRRLLLLSHGNPGCERPHGGGGGGDDAGHGGGWQRRGGGEDCAGDDQPGSSRYDEHVISPKEFVHLAGKSTLKDWKRAIRMNGIMLRKIMDSGELDFYQHDKVCSNTCRSTKIDLSGARVSLSSPTSAEYIPLTPATADVNGSPATITIETCEDPGDWTTAIADDTFSFWRGLKDAGLLDEVIHEFHQELMETMKGLQQRVQDPPLQLRDAVLLNNIVQNFGMLDLVKKVLASHKCQMDRSREQYARDLAALEQQCDEHRRRAKELKHKSQHLSNVLMTLTPVSLPPPAKRPRLARATSGPAAIASQVLTQSAQIALSPGVPVSQLTGVPLGKVVSALPSPALGKGPTQAAPAGSPASPLLGGYTVLASSGATFPSTVEIHPDASSLTVLSTAAMQDGSTVVKVVSPLQLLTLPGLGPTLQNVAQVSPGGSTIVTVPTGAVESAVAASGPEEHTATIEVAAMAEGREHK